MTSKHIEAVEHEMELQEFHRFHRWIWRLQYVFMALVVATAALSVAGLFGGGWISRAQASGDGVAIAWQRFTRYGNETVLEARLSAGKGSVAIPFEYFGRFKLDAVVPEPREQRMQGNRVVFEFNATAETVVRFHLLPLEPGRSETSITIGDTPFVINQFTWP